MHDEGSGLIDIKALASLGRAQPEQPIREEVDVLLGIGTGHPLASSLLAPALRPVAKPRRDRGLIMALGAVGVTVAVAAVAIIAAIVAVRPHHAAAPGAPGAGPIHPGEDPLAAAIARPEVEQASPVATAPEVTTDDVEVVAAQPEAEVERPTRRANRRARARRRARQRMAPEPAAPAARPTGPRDLETLMNGAI